MGYCLEGTLQILGGWYVLFKICPSLCTASLIDGAMFVFILPSNKLTNSIIFSWIFSSIKYSGIGIIVGMIEKVSVICVA